MPLQASVTDCCASAAVHTGVGSRAPHLADAVDQVAAHVELAQGQLVMVLCWGGGGTAAGWSEGGKQQAGGEEAQRQAGVRFTGSQVHRFSAGTLSPAAAALLATAGDVSAGVAGPCSHLVVQHVHEVAIEGVNVIHLQGGYQMYAPLASTAVAS